MRSPIALLVLLAACSGEPAKGQPTSSAQPAAAETPGEPVAPAPAGQSCRKDKGCQPTAALPACAPGLAVQTLADVMASGHRLLGKTISVRGPLRHTTAACEPDSCGAPCCKTCSAHLVLSPRDDVAWPAGAPDSLLLESEAKGQPPDSLVCHGDESQLCCPVEGADVVATGRLRQAGMAMDSKTRALDAVTLCQAK